MISRLSCGDTRVTKQSYAHFATALKSHMDDLLLGDVACSISRKNWDKFWGDIFAFGELEDRPNYRLQKYQFLQTLRAESTSQAAHKAFGVPQEGSST